MKLIILTIFSLFLSLACYAENSQCANNIEKNVNAPTSKKVFNAMPFGQKLNLLNKALRECKKCAPEAVCMNAYNHIRTNQTLESVTKALGMIRNSDKLSGLKSKTEIVPVKFVPVFQEQSRIPRTIGI